MWNNYIISMIRNYKSWSGLPMVNLLMLIAAFSLLSTLIKIFILSHAMMFLIIILIIAFVISIAYANFLALQLRKRQREIHIRKLLGAGDVQLLHQLLMESVLVIGFVVVSGMVLAELVAPICRELLNFAPNQNAISFAMQVLVVIVLVILIGILAAIPPIIGFIARINKHLSLSTNRP